MSTVIQCPHCKSNLRNRSNKPPGSRVRCAKCKQYFEIPKAPTVPSSPPGEAATATPSRDAASPAGVAPGNGGPVSQNPGPPSAPGAGGPFLQTPPAEGPPPVADVPVPPAPPPLVAAASGETAAAETFLGDQQAETNLWETHLRRIRSDLKWMNRLLVFALVALVIGAAGNTVSSVLLFMNRSDYDQAAEVPAPSQGKPDQRGEKPRSYQEVLLQRFQELQKSVERGNRLHEQILQELRPEYGRVVVVASWKYNDPLGHRPDVNSVVVLFPAQLKKKLKYPVAALENERFPMNYDHPDVHAGWIGVDGRCVFSRVKPGNYKLLIISANTNTTEAKKLTERLEQYFSDVVGLNKVFLTDIVVHPGEEIEINHDFGITSF